MNIYGGNTGVTYADIQRKRKMAEQLVGQNSGTPRNVGEGLNAIGRALMARSVTRKADRAQDAIVQQLGMNHPVVQKLLGVPAYRTGTSFHPGGPAIVGEDGPEIAWLPRGAAVQPNPATGLPQDRQREMDAMTPEQKAIIQQILNGGTSPDDAFTPDGSDPRSLIMEQGALDDSRAYKVADAGNVASDALPYGDAKLTEGQSKDVGYFTRGTAANTLLTNPKMEKALTQFTDTFAENFGGVGRLFQDAEYQEARRAANEFLAVILRKDTGAAVTPAEFDLYGPMYLPMPGDKQELIDAKRKAREIALTGIEMGLGTAAPLGQIAKEKYGPQDMSDDEFLKSLGL